MKPIKLIVNSSKSILTASNSIARLQKEHKYLTVSISAGANRSVKQNSLWAAMYKRLGEYAVFESALEAKKYCKLIHGVSILREDDNVFCGQWRDTMSHMTYESQTEMMGPCSLFGNDGFPVTRLFTRDQGVRYTELMSRDQSFIDCGVSFRDILSEG